MMLFNERPGIVLRYLALCPLRGCDGPCWGSIPANFARVYGFTDSRRDGPNQREGDAGISESKRGRITGAAQRARAVELKHLAVNRQLYEVRAGAEHQLREEERRRHHLSSPSPATAPPSARR